MVTLSPDKALRSKKPEILVENPLKPGKYVVRLVVVDNDKLESDPTDLTIVVREGRSPTPTPVFRPELVANPVLAPVAKPAPTPVAKPALTPVVKPVVVKPKPRPGGGG
jgi:hypothetical protein